MTRISIFSHSCKRKAHQQIIISTVCHSIIVCPGKPLGYNLSGTTDKWRHHAVTHIEK